MDNVHCTNHMNNHLLKSMKHLKKLSHQKGLIEVEKEVAEKSKVHQCQQQLFLLLGNKFKNPVTNHFEWALFIQLLVDAKPKGGRK